MHIDFDVILMKLFEGLMLTASSRLWIWVVGQFKWWRFSPWYKKYIIKVEQFTISQRPRMSFGIQRIGKIQRVETDEILLAWQACNQIILTGPAGSGKTGIGWAVVETLRRENQVVLYLDCSNISITQNVLEKVQPDLDRQEEIEQALQKIGQNTTLYCVIDQLDHLVRISPPSNLAQLIEKLSGFQGLRILVIVRDFEFEQSKNLQDFEFQVVRSKELQVAEAIRYLELVGISKPPENLVALAQNLFNLSLISDMYASGRDIRDVLGQIQLLERYVRHIALDEGQSTIERAVKLARKHMATPHAILEGTISEPSIQRLLSRGVLVIDQLRRLRFRHEVIEEYLCSLGLLSEAPELPKLLTEFGEGVTRRIVSCLIAIYHDKSPADETKLADAVLTSDSNFYFKAAILDAIRFQHDPSIKMAEVIANFLNSGKETYTRYFFQGLDTPVWVKLLHDQKYFYVVPPPQEDPNNPSYFSLPIWHAGEYLKANASVSYDVAIDVMLKVETENANAIRTMLSTIMLIPADAAPQLVDVIEKWSKTNFGYTMMLANEIGLVMEHFAKANQIVASLQVLNILVSPLPVKDRFDEGKIIAGTRHDLYWLNHVFVHNLPSLFSNNSMNVAEVLEKRLIEAIDLEVDPHIPLDKNPGYSYWRLNIRPDFGRDQPRSLKDLLVNGLIRSLEEGLNQSQEEIFQVITKYLGSPYVILKRIAVYWLRFHGHQYPDLNETVYQAWKTKPWAGGLDEFEHFLDAQFGNFSSQTRFEILNTIYSYLDSEEFTNWFERAVEYESARMSGDTLEEKKVSLREEYEFRQLHRFAKWLTDGQKDRYEILSTKYPTPAPRLEAGIFTSWVESDESPIAVEEISKKSVQEVVQYLVDFVPAGVGIRATSRDELAQVFKTVVKVRMEEFVENSSLLIRNDLPLVYHRSYLAALGDAIKEGQRITILSIVDLCDFIVGAKEDVPGENQYQSSLQQTKREVAHLIEQFLRTGPPYLDDDALNRIGKLILVLASEEDDASLEKDDGSEDPSEIDARTLSSNLDAATRSLNSIRGYAVHCLFHYAWHLERKRKAEGGDKNKPVMPPLVRDVLMQKLDKRKDPSLAVHAVIGWYFVQIVYLDYAWAIDNRERIFPLDQSLKEYWIAAWSAYIRFSGFYGKAFEALLTHYKLAVALLPYPKNQALDRIDESLAEHLLQAYLMELIDLESNDSLLKSYYMHASDEVRSHGNFWLSKTLEVHQPTVQDLLWVKIWNLWQWRIAEVSASENKDQHQSEIGSFSRLLKYAPLELDALHPVLSQAIEFNNEDHFVFFEIIEYLGKNAERHLIYAVELLLRILRKKRLLYLSDENRNDVAKILEQAKIRNDTVAKQHAIEIINILGESGDYTWRGFLNDIE